MCTALEPANPSLSSTLDTTLDAALHAELIPQHDMPPTTASPKLTNNMIHSLVKACQAKTAEPVVVETVQDNDDMMMDDKLMALTIPTKMCTCILQEGIILAYIHTEDIDRMDDEYQQTYNLDDFDTDYIPG